MDNKILDELNIHADNMMDFLPSLSINEFDHGQVFWKAAIVDDEVNKNTGRGVFFLTPKLSSIEVSESPEVPFPP